MSYTKGVVTGYVIFGITVVIAFAGLYWIAVNLHSFSLWFVNDLSEDQLKIVSGTIALVIVGVLTFLGGIYAVTKNNKSIRHRQIEAHFRETKTKIYNDFLGGILNLLNRGVCINQAHTALMCEMARIGSPHTLFIIIANCKVKTAKVRYVRTFFKCFCAICL